MTFPCMCEKQAFDSHVQHSSCVKLLEPKFCSVLFPQQIARGSEIECKPKCSRYTFPLPAEITKVIKWDMIGYSTHVGGGMLLVRWAISVLPNAYSKGARLSSKATTFSLPCIGARLSSKGLSPLFACLQPGPLIVRSRRLLCHPRVTHCTKKVYCVIRPPLGKFSPNGVAYISYGPRAIHICMMGLTYIYAYASRQGVWVSHLACHQSQLSTNAGLVGFPF